MDCPNYYKFKGLSMKLVLFKNLLDKYSSLQYGIVGDNESLGVKKLCDGGTVSYGDYEILKTISESELSGLLKLDKYVVCMDPYWVCDAQMIDVSDVEDINDINSFANDLDDRWRDMEPMPFIAVIEAVSEDDACRIAAEQYRYDHRCLFAQKI